MTAHITVVGIGAEGLAGLGPHERDLLQRAEVVLGGRRHLAMLPDAAGQDREAWPSPLRPGLPALLERYAGRRIVALASGDPLVSGIAATLIEAVGADADSDAEIDVHPAISSVALARARMGWPAEETEIVSLVGRDPRVLIPRLHPGARLLLLSSDGDQPAEVARLLCDIGYAASGVTVLADLGTTEESRTESTAADWSGTAPALNIVAVDAVGPALGSLAPGLSDDSFEDDGQLTASPIRALALARLAPQPGDLLWDVGAGAGSVGIEWMRLHPRCRAIAIERDPDRAARIERNAGRLGVPGLQVVRGPAPAALADLPAPDAVFVGGGATGPGVLDRARESLNVGGRLVVHGVTLETQALLLQAATDVGGDLVRLHAEVAQPLGRFRSWQPARAIVQWAWTKPEPSVTKPRSTDAGR